MCEPTVILLCNLYKMTDLSKKFTLIFIVSNILGNPGWNYDNVLKYFIKSEDNRNPYLSKTPYHGTGGLLTVQEAPWRTPLVVAFVQAGTEMGYQNRDINGAEQAGKYTN